MNRPFKGKYPITQEWGVNPADYAKFGLKGHNGVDYGTPTGTPILAPHSGKVIEVAYDQYGYGTYVKIENDEEGSILAHLSTHEVNPGDNITEGTKIGESGSTGNSTGPHLHWGYYRKPRDKSNGYSGTCNPWQYLDENKPQPPTDPCESFKTELETVNRKLALTEQDNKTKDVTIKTLREDLLDSQNKVKPLQDEAAKYKKAIDKVKEGLVGV